MKTQFDIPALQKVYSEQNNLKVITGECKGRKKRIALFFSGNGLYYPNTEEVFEEVIEKKNRYEWENIAASLLPNFHQLIFIRDICKTWYSEGISINSASVDEVYKLLKELTKDCDRIICIGNSAGGYAALLFGSLLNAEVIYSFSGFVYLDEEICLDPLNPKLLQAMHTPNKLKWLDLRNLIASCSSQIFFFYPAYSTEDLKQVAYLGSAQNITKIAIDSAEHGVGPSGKTYSQLISFRYKRIKKKFQKESSVYSIADIDEIIVSNEFKLFKLVKRLFKKR